MRNQSGEIEGAITREKPEIVIIDSIQTMYQEEVSAAPGSVSQVRESTGVFLKLAKGYGISIFIVGHVTKEGTVAGPRVLEHMVDTVLYFEGDRHASYRILRGSEKPVWLDQRNQGSSRCARKAFVR